MTRTPQIVFKLLDTYDAERRPVGAFVLRFTDRAFTAATSTAPPVRFARTHLAPRALRLAAHLPRLRAVAFHVVSQLSIRYPDLLHADPVAGGLTSRVRARLPGPRPGPGSGGPTSGSGPPDRIDGCTPA